MISFFPFSRSSYQTRPLTGPLLDLGRALPQQFEQMAARRRRHSSSTSSTAGEHTGPRGKECPKSQRQGGGEEQAREGGDSVARKSSSHNPGLDGPADASQDSTANASAVAANSRGGRATGLASLESRQGLWRASSASRSLRPAGDILSAHNGERAAPRRRGDEGVAVGGIDADAPSDCGSPINEPLLPPPGL